MSPLADDIVLSIILGEMRVGDGLDRKELESFIVPLPSRPDHD